MNLHCPIALVTVVGLVAVAAVSPARALAQTAPSASSSPSPTSSGHRPSVLMMTSYAVTAVVQGLDAHSTFKAIDAGAVETNPLLTPLANNRAAFVALKAAIAAALIYEGHGTGKQHKIRALLILGAIDGAYIALARHNYRVARVMNGR